MCTNAIVFIRFCPASKIDSRLSSFKLEDCKGVELPNYGVEGLFPNDDLAVGFIYDWKEILQNHGKGTYTIRVDFTIAGLSGGYELRKMDLRNYSFDNVKNSVRIYSEFNSYFEPDDIDFTGSNFKDTVRFNGFFGNREPETEVSNLIGKNREVEKVIRENLNKHTLRTDLIEIGMSNQLIDFHLLSQDVTKISDYNRFNHDYNILDKSVVLIDTPKVEYKEMDRRMLLTATFGDKKMQDRSFYR